MTATCAVESDARRFHWFGYVAALSVAGTLLLVNADGYLNHIGGDIYATDIMWVHGWPLPFATRAPSYPLSRGPTGERLTRISGPTGAYSRWPIDNAPVFRFWPRSLFVDCVVFIVLVLGAGYGAGRWAARGELGNHFSLRWLFVLTLLAGLGLRYGHPWLRETDSRIVGHYLAMSILAAAAVLTLYACGCLTISCYLRLRRAKAPGLSVEVASAD